MSSHNADEDSYGYDDDDDKKFYRGTVYNESYYIEREMEYARNIEREMLDRDREKEERAREDEEDSKEEERDAQFLREWEEHERNYESGLAIHSQLLQAIRGWVEFEKNHHEEAAEIERDAKERGEDILTLLGIAAPEDHETEAEGESPEIDKSLHQLFTDNDIPF